MECSQSFNWLCALCIHLEKRREDNTYIALETPPNSLNGNSARNLPQSKEISTILDRGIAPFIMSVAILFLFVSQKSEGDLNVVSDCGAIHP